MSRTDRDFSFETHDDNPSYYPLHPATGTPRPPPHQGFHGHGSPSDSSWEEVDTPYPASYPPQSRGMDPSNSEDYRGGGEAGIEQQGTVIRKSIPPAAAAAAAATLAAVQEDLAPPSHAFIDRGSTPAGGMREDNRYWGQELGYSRSITATPAGMVGGHGLDAPAYPPSVSTPSSQVPLFPGPPQPPQHHWDGSSGSGSPGGRQRVLVDPVAGHYTDNPYKRSSTTWDPSLQVGIDGAHDVLSDDDEDYGRRNAAVAGADASGAIGVTAGANLRGGAVERGGLLSKGGNGPSEKSAWLRSKEKSSKKTKWIVAIVLILLILGVAGGVTAGVLVSRNNNGSDKSSESSSSGAAAGGGGSDLSAEEDVKVNGDLNKNSPEIKKLLDNPDLHKVFHGMDYTPLGGVYPECLTWPPTQNNITRDIAVLSLLTDKVRLYSTDCNQTEMVLQAIDVLEVDMKVWIGVWLDGNSTTNTRQLDQLYKLVEVQDYHDKFDGVAVGNEVLFAETLTETELFTIIEEVRSNLTDLGYDIPVGTSDLGSNWNANMASKVDVLMANVHPFFAGVTVEEAADWTWDFFLNNDVAYTEGLSPKPRVMISEVGWPSGGGKDRGSVAGIPELNRFMDDFVCRENKKGTEYFWFSGFDEPWKIRYNEPKLGKEWEDKWGLLDVNRKLKKGLTIPDCK